MLAYKNNPKEELKKTKPSIVAPIANTVFSVLGIIFLTLAYILTEDFITLRLYLCCLVVLIMFPVSSWILSYFSKKQKAKTLKSYDDETELIIKFMDYKKNYYTVHEDEKNKVRVKLCDELCLNNYHYDDKKSSLGLLDSKCAYIALGVGFISLEVNPETGLVQNIKGLLPKSIWLKKNFKDVTPTKKGIIIETTGVSLKGQTYIHINSRDDTYYNKKTGFICVGDYRTYAIDDVVEFMDNAYLVIRDGVIISLRLKVGTIEE